MPVGKSRIPEGSHSPATRSPEVTGLFCRVPSPTLRPIRLGLLRQGPCVGSGYERDASCRSLFKGVGIGRLAPQAEPHSPFLRRPIVTVLGRVIGLARAKAPDRLSPRVGIDPMLPCNVSGTGILTRFPFGRDLLSTALGSTYPRLMTHRRGNLTLTAVRFLTALRFYCCRDYHYGPLHGTLPPRFKAARTPACPITPPEGVGAGFGGVLEPRPFSVLGCSTGALLRVL